MSLFIQACTTAQLRMLKMRKKMKRMRQKRKKRNCPLFTLLVMTVQPVMISRPRDSFRNQTTVCQLASSPSPSYLLHGVLHVSNTSSLTLSLSSIYICHCLCIIVNASRPFLLFVFFSSDCNYSFLGRVYFQFMIRFFISDDYLCVFLCFSVTAPGPYLTDQFLQILTRTD